MVCDIGVYHANVNTLSKEALIICFLKNHYLSSKDLFDWSKVINCFLSVVQYLCSFK